MKLESYIAGCVWEYPSLYYRNDWKTTRQLVLNHLFLVNGNGIEYHNPQNLPGKGIFKGGSRDKIRSKNKEIQNRFKSGEKLVRIYNKIDKKWVNRKFDDFVFIWPDRESKEYGMFLDDYLKLNKKYLEVGSKIKYNDSKTLSFNNLIEIYPEIDKKYNWSPYPFSFKYNPLWDWENNKLIPKENIAPDWLAGILEIWKQARDWVEDDNKFLKDEYFNWAALGKDNQQFINKFNKQNDIVKFCIDYGIELYAYESAKDMAEAIVKKSRQEYVDTTNQIIQFYS